MVKGRFPVRLVAALGAAGAAFAVSAGEALAASCVYDAGAKSVAVGMDPGSVTTLSVSGGSLLVDGTVCLGATTTNTDSISIAGHAGSDEQLVLDQRSGVFGPGATPESNVPEIEMTASLGDATDKVVVFGTEGADEMAAGENGIALYGDGDVDVVVTPHAFNLHVLPLGGDDFFNGRGTFGAGLAFKGPIYVGISDGDDYLRGSVASDTINGGAGNDDIEGNFGHDLLHGGLGDDAINGGSDGDTIFAGPGRDSVIAGSGDDTVWADDGEADASLVGGANADTLIYDCGGLDPAPSQFETLTCGGTTPPPPPPPSGPCVYDPATMKVKVTMYRSGTPSQIQVAEGRIYLDGMDCGGTTANTESIEVLGSPWGRDILTILVDGFVGGTTEPAGVSEIEINLAMGDAVDRVGLQATSTADTISVGARGIATNADGDVDIAFVGPLPELVAINGFGGDDHLSGRGGSGAGTAFPNTLTFTGQAGNDTMIGGLGLDYLYGSVGDDVLEGREGDDILYGEAGNDSLAGQGGNDYLLGDIGADSLIGGAEDDILRADDGEGDVVVNGGPGIDTANYDAALDTSVVAVEIRNPT